MATLEKIRSKAGLLVGAVGIALLAFILGDLLRGGNTYRTQSKDKIAIVNGQSIGSREFQNEQEAMQNNLKSRMGGSVTEEQQNQIREMVFEEMVGSILLNEQSEKIGFGITQEERTDMLMGDNISPMIQQIPDFQNPQTKTFDRNRLIQFLQMIESDDWSSYSPEAQQQLQRAKDFWLTIEKNVVEQKLISKFSTLLTSSIVANSLDAKDAFNNNSVNVDFRYVFQSYNQVPDSVVAVSDDEIAKAYNLQKQNYKQEHAKVVSFIAVNVEPSEADFKDVSDRIEKLKNELAGTTNPADLIDENSDVAFLDAFVSATQLSEEAKNFAAHASIGDIEGPVLTGKTYNMYKLLDVKQAPDSIKLYQISFSNADEARVKSLTDSLINVIRSGKSFTEVATEVSNGQSNGDAGWKTEASLVSAIDAKYANALFDAKLNDPFTVKTSRGIVLAQVVEKTAPVKKYKIAAIKMEATPSEETYHKLYTNLNQYLSKNNKLEKFKSAAAEAGYVCQTDIQLLENQPTIGNIGNSRQVIRWAYNHSKGDISEIFECQGYFIAAAVEGELKAGVRSMKDISDILKRELINEKKGEKIVAFLKAKNLSSLDDYATAMNSTVQDVKFVTFATPRISGIGSEPVVNARALASEVGKLTDPFAGKIGVYVLSLTAKNTSTQKYDEAQQKQQLNMQNSYMIMQMVQSSRLLKDKATIEDNRSRFY